MTEIWSLIGFAPKIAMPNLGHPKRDDAMIDFIRQI
jgi:hypothetical protein